MTVRAEGRATVEVSASAGSPVALATQTAPELKLAGKAYLGSMLAVNAGEWPEGTRLTYQWLREGEEVVGAVSSGYALVAADLGQRIQVRVTGHRSGYADAVAISGKSAPVAKAAGNGGDPDVPELVPAGELSILGSTTVGKTLTLRTTGWSSGVVLAPQWYRNGSAIPGASNSSYTLSAADLAARISVRVIAAKPGLVSIEMRGSVGSTVRPGVVPRFSSPTISGAVKAGRVVTAKLAKVPAGAKVKYAWLLNGKVVKNAKSYRVRTADVGKTLKLRVTVTKPGYTPQSKASAAKRVQSR